MKTDGPLKFATQRCSLGWVSVVWSTHGVRAVAMADEANALKRELASQFSELTLTEQNSSPWVKAVREAIDQGTAANVPLDWRGTEFQKRVWQQLLQIPAGETRTYSEIAKALKAPKSVRAVARACATNELGILVPCHRVVRSDGSLAGYRWGVERKAALLKRERGQ